MAVRPGLAAKDESCVMQCPMGRILGPMGRILGPMGKMLSPMGKMLSPMGKMHDE